MKINMEENGSIFLQNNTRSGETAPPCSFHIVHYDSNVECEMYKEMYNFSVTPPAWHHVPNLLTHFFHIITTGILVLIALEAMA